MEDYCKSHKNRCMNYDNCLQKGHKDCLNLNCYKHNYRWSQGGMAAPIHMGLGAIVGLVCWFLGASIPSMVCAILLSIYSHVWIDAYNKEIDHIIEKEPLRTRIKFWCIVGVGLALVALCVWKYTYLIVILCILGASAVDLDHGLKYIPGYPFEWLHKLIRHKWLVDEGSNRARVLSLALLFGVILL